MVNFDKYATIGKWVGMIIIFIIFYVILSLTPYTVGLAIILAILAGNVVELKIMFYKVHGRRLKD